MLKTGGTCQLTKLPEYMNVATMVKEFDSNDGTKSNEIKTKYVLKAAKSRFGSTRRKELLPEVQDLCKKVPLVQTDDFEANATDYEKLNRGEMVYLKKARSKRGCMQVGIYGIFIFYMTTLSSSTRMLALQWDRKLAEIPVG